MTDPVEEAGVISVRNEAEGGEKKYDITKFKPLNSEQRQRAGREAVNLVLSGLGEEPTRESFTRQYGTTRWDSFIDITAIFIFVMALAASSTHIVAHMGQQAKISFMESNGTAGIRFSADSFTFFNQLPYFFMAELAMIFFAMLHFMRSSERRGRRLGFGRYSIKAEWLSISSLLAVGCGTFVLKANLESGMGLVESLLPPAVTIGLGLYLEGRWTSAIQRNLDIETNYSDAYNAWKLSHNNPEENTKYPPAYHLKLWESLLRLKGGEYYRDAPSVFKAAAVRRELAEERWSIAIGDDGGVNDPFLAPKLLVESSDMPSEA